MYLLIRTFLPRNQRRLSPSCSRNRRRHGVRSTPPVPTPQKGGFTVISTDHKAMGQQVAQMIETGTMKKIHNASALIQRESL